MEMREFGSRLTVLSEQPFSPDSYVIDIICLFGIGFIKVESDQRLIANELSHVSRCVTPSITFDFQLRLIERLIVENLDDSLQRLRLIFIGRIFIIWWIVIRVIDIVSVVNIIRIVDNVIIVVIIARTAGKRRCRSRTASNKDASPSKSLCRHVMFTTSTGCAESILMPNARVLGEHRPLSFKRVDGFLFNEMDEAVDVLELLGDAYARCIIAHAEQRPMSPRELESACDAHHSTIYRRINQLQETTCLQRANGWIPTDTTTASTRRTSNG